MSKYDSDKTRSKIKKLIKHDSLIPQEQILPKTLYILPMTNRPYFPGQIQPLLVDTEYWGDTLRRVVATEHRCLGLCYSHGVDTDKIKNEDIAVIGTLAQVHGITASREQVQFIAQGIQRIRVVRWIKRKPPYLVEVEYPVEPKEEPDETKAYALALVNILKELVPLNPLYGTELKQYLEYFSPNAPSPLCDFAAALTSANGEILQGVLETLPVLQRMKRVLPLAHKEFEIVKMQSEISQEVNHNVTEHQREFFLKEQLRVIEEELGIKKNDKQTEVDEFEERLKGKVLTKAAQKRIQEELNKLAILESGSPEFAVTRNYLEWVTALPWGIYSEDKLDIVRAREVLDEDHESLEEVKDRVIEFLAIGVYRKEVTGSIMLLVGPPGVGKTSIGKSVASALGRKFYSFSLGGVRDEAEIKGHRRTYIGALPGRFIQALKEVEVSNPVIMLDEVDKIGASYHGDPASALLEALDPEQNATFLDHYLDLRVDLSKVLFICTANQVDTIPAPLLDRMDSIELSGYIAQEKKAIAKNHTIPKLYKKNGIDKSALQINDAALRAIIEGYSRDAGIRSMEKQINRIIRKVIVLILQGEVTQVKINKGNLEEYLGPAPYENEKLLHGIGVVTGLAWTPLGGKTLPIEAISIHHKKRGFKLTGQLGDVMKESAEIAYSVVAARSDKYGIKGDFFDNAFLHLHVPEGATPKDGPSAGITMASSLLSLATNKQVRRSMAMTGELTLTGKVLAVGGIREKVVAARRGGIDEIIIPVGSRDSYQKLPDYLRKGLDAHFVDDFEDVARLIL